jgi:adenylate cyclase
MALVAALVVLLFELLAGAIGGSIATLLLLAIIAAGSWLAFIEERLLLDPVLPAAAALLAFAAATPVLLLWTDRERRFIRGAFGRYLSPELVGRLARNPDALSLGGEIRELTVLFSDIRNFTTLSEGLAPDALTSLLNDFLTPATDVLLGAEATLDKYIGDAIMAFWNAPLDIAGHPRKACLGALEMIAALNRLNARSGRSLSIGIGLNSGPCCVGNFGSSRRFNYSALGDAVNVASRVEGLTKQYHVPILVAEPTRRAAGDLAFLEADRVRVVGRSEPLPVHVLLGDAAYGQSGPFLALEAVHLRLLAAYRALDFEAAETALASTRALAPPSLAGLYDVYGERLATMRRDPPPVDWDGVFTAREK